MTTRQEDNMAAYKIALASYKATGIWYTNNDPIWGTKHTDLPQLPIKTWATIVPLEEEIRLMTDEYNKGIEIREIADKYGFSRGTVKYAVGNTEAYL